MNSILWTLLTAVRRFQACGFPHWQFSVLRKVGRPSLYSRVSENSRQQANVQGRRHLSGTAGKPTLKPHNLTLSRLMKMLVVENKIPSEEVVTSQKNVNIDEFIWPHGVTPPLHHVRKRRFRKRVNRRVSQT